MKLLFNTVLVAVQALRARAHQQSVFSDLSSDSDRSSPLWSEKYGAQSDLVFTGPVSFAHLPYSRCLEENTSPAFDIALLGMPFDTAVTYRPGARFGPTGIRIGSRRIHDKRGWSLSWGLDPFHQGLDIIDCGDVPISPFDNALALDQMEVAYSTLLQRDTAHTGLERTIGSTRRFAKDNKEHPRIVSLGGDHTIVLPILRSLNKVYGPISVIHFDAHLDSWAPRRGANQSTPQGRITHGSFFYIAREEGLLSNTNVHAGIRCKMSSEADLAEDEEVVGFEVISTDDIDEVGINEVIRRIRARVGDSPVYLSFDIDVIDPGLAPATGTPEPGGWTTREVKRIIRGLAGLNFIGADVVEVAPAYDHADITSIAAADIVHDLLSLFVSAEPPKLRGERQAQKGVDEL